MAAGERDHVARLPGAQVQRSLGQDRRRDPVGELLAALDPLRRDGPRRRPHHRDAPVRDAQHRTTPDARPPRRRRRQMGASRLDPQLVDRDLRGREQGRERLALHRHRLPREDRGVEALLGGRAARRARGAVAEQALDAAHAPDRLLPDQGRDVALNGRQARQAVARAGGVRLHARQQRVPHPGPGALEVLVRRVLAPRLPPAIEPGAQLVPAHPQERPHDAAPARRHAVQVRGATQRLQEDGLRLIVDGVRERDRVGPLAARQPVQRFAPQTARGVLEVPATLVGDGHHRDLGHREAHAQGRREPFDEGRVRARGRAQPVVDVQDRHVHAGLDEQARERHAVASARDAHARRAPASGASARRRSSTTVPRSVASGIPASVPRTGAGVAEPDGRGRLGACTAAAPSRSSCSTPWAWARCRTPTRSATRAPTPSTTRSRPHRSTSRT